MHFKFIYSQINLILTHAQTLFSLFLIEYIELSSIFINNFKLQKWVEFTVNHNNITFNLNKSNICMTQKIKLGSFIFIYSR